MPSPLGIDPKIDFAFKRVFGSLDHPRITIHFLNAVLDPVRPITAVEILNPIQDRDRVDAKLAILDVMAQDADDHRYNIQMQTTVPVDLRSRLTYYNCANYVRQLGSGSSYHSLRPAISICVLNRLLFGHVANHHLSFRLRCDQRDLVFTDDLVFHTLELPKFVVPSDNALLGLSKLDQWFCFLKLAADRNVHELAQLLGDDVFEEAAGVLAMISESPEDRVFYEARLRYLQNEEARLAAACEEARKEGREEGRAEGMDQGMEKGMEKGIEKGMEKGMEKGAAQGALVGKVQLLQELLSDSVAATSELLCRSSDELSAQISELQERLRTRGD